MMIWSLLQLFWGFFVANALGYGGGPSTIPLMEVEIVERFKWLTSSQFIDALALANALPGPISSKVASFVGFKIAGFGGVAVALVATIVPSAIALILLLGLLQRFRKSTVVKGMTLLIQPVIAVMMIVLTWQFGQESIKGIGMWQSVGIAAISLWAMIKGKIHPALVIVIAFAYGGLVISRTI